MLRRTPANALLEVCDTGETPFGTGTHLEIGQSCPALSFFFFTPFFLDAHKRVESLKFVTLDIFQMCVVFFFRFFTDLFFSPTSLVFGPSSVSG